MLSLLKHLHWMWPTRIRYQLIGGVALVHLLLMTVFVVDLVGRQREFLKQQSLEATQGLVQTLAVNSVSWVLANDVVGLEEVILSARQYPGLRYAMVVTGEGHVLAHTDTACIGQYVSDESSRALLTADARPQVLHRDHTLLDIAAPVVSATGKTVAWARVGQGQEPIWNNLRIASRNGLLYTLLAIGVGSVLAVLIGNRLTSGLNQLVLVSGQIRDGRRDLRMEVCRADEVSRVGEGINEMLEAIISSEARFRVLFEQAPDAILVYDAERERFLDANHNAERLFGCPRDELLKQGPRHRDGPETVDSGRSANSWRDHAERALAGDNVVFEQALTSADGRELHCEVRLSRLPAAHQRLLRCSYIDITERKQAEREREALIELLHLLNTSDDTHAMMRATTALLSRIADCAAVGIRLREGEDFPYFETRGFSDEFVRMEDRLCARDERGELVRDSAGDAVLECMCGNVLCGRFDPSKPFFTPRGSFWTSCTTELLASTTEAERQARTRNRCNGEGYESVALLPLRVGGATIGLIQFNDRRRGRFSPEKIAMLERFAGHLAIGLAHRRTEAALRESEERYRTVADFTYDWETWTGPDGALLYCSPACERVTGYRAEEFARDPGLLAAIIHADDRAQVGSHFAESSSRSYEPREFEYRIRTRNGEERWIAHVCQAVRGRDGAYLGRRASNRDITAPKRTEGINLARLRLLQFAATHSLDELLEATLNEAEGLTGSLIGFYHFLEPDQKTLALQNWSTRTKAEFCTAVGKGLHYDVSAAGVWVDCIHERRPIIHNDYAALPHRKGLPPGHAPVTRELVVPVFRGDKIVAMLGVGNKPRDYDQDDVETISLLADLAWEIVERKRAEEEVWTSEKRYRTAQAVGHVGNWEYNLQTTRFWGSDEAKRIYGFGPEDTEFSTDEVEGCIPERARVHRALVDLIEQGIPYDLEFEIHPRNSSETRVISSIAELQRDERGNPLKIVGVVQDITERKRTEASIALRNFALDNVHEAAFLIGKDARLHYVNEGACRALGYTRDELLALSVADFDPDFPAARWPAHWDQLKAQRSLTFEGRHRTKDGRLLPVEISANYFEYDGQEYNLALARDISERKRMEQEVTRLASFPLRNPQPIVEVDATGRVSFANPEAQRLFADLEQRGTDHPWLADWQRLAAACRGEEALPNNREVAVAGRWYHQSLYWVSEERRLRIYGLDITARKHADQRLRRLNRELRALSKCNETLMRAVDEQTLLTDVCRIVCDVAGYRMAWVGLAEHDDAQSVRLAARAGVDNGYLARARITWADTEHGRGPTGTAIRTGASVCLQDFATHPAAAPWREAALRRGYRSSIALPLKDEHARVLGALSIYSAEPNAFIADEVRLLEELAGDLAFGLTVLRTRTERQRAEEELRAKTEELNHFFDLSLDLLCIADTDGHFARLNPSWECTLGYPLTELQGPRFFEFIHPDDVEPTRGAVATLAAQRRVTDFINRYRCADGSYRWLEWRSAPVGKRIYAVARDITERRAAEAALLRSERQKTILNRIASVMLTVAGDEMYGDVLAVILDALQSKYGIFGYLSDDDLVIPSLTRDVWSQCQVSDKSIVFPASSWGGSLWGRAIREKRSFASAGPFHVPTGHVDIHSFLTTPIVLYDRTIGILSVANREGAYGEEEIALLETIASYVAPILNTRLQRDRLERERQRAEEQIVRQLREKELLVREIHHRVKNNMQVISSLLDLQARQSGSERLREWLNASRGRIRTMALVHERLYTAQDMARINFKDYVQALVAESLGLYGVAPDRIEVRVDVEPWTLPIATAVPCGLIIHELLSNALRHAFPGERPGCIHVTLARGPDGWADLTVRDDGVGIPADLDFGATESLGLRLVRILATDQLNGTVHLARECGTEVRVHFAEGQS